MYINRGVGKGWASSGKVYVTAYRETSIEVTIFKPVNYAGGCHWLTVWLRPLQAVKVANLLLSPPGRLWVDFADPAPPPAPQGEHREAWDVIKATSNGVHEAWIGIAKGKISISHYCFGFSHKPGLTDYFHGEWTEELTRRECRTLAGILFHWAGAMLIGYRTKHKKTTKRTLPLSSTP